MNDAPAEEPNVPADVPAEVPLESDSAPVASASQPEPEEIPSTTEPVESTTSENPHPDETRADDMQVEPTALNGDISAADETVIAEILARDLDELDRSREMEIVEDNHAPATNVETNDTPDQGSEPVNPPVVEPVASGDQNGEIPATEDSQMEGSPIDESPRHSENDENNENNGNDGNNENNENVANETAATENETPDYPDLIHPSSHVYCFLQQFDEEEQVIHLHGAFFVKRNQNIKKAVRSALEWDDDKEFLLWHRLEGRQTRAVSPSDKFKNVVRTKHGERFIVGNVLTKARYVCLHESIFTPCPKKREIND